MLIALTGASGFLGRATCRALLAGGCRINAMTRTPLALPGLTAFGCSPREIHEAVVNADAIVHLATCYGREGETVESVVNANILLPALLAEEAALRGIPLLLGDSFFSKSDAVYEYLPTYVASKRACQAMAMGVIGARAPVAQVVFEHLYGPGDDRRKAIPHLLSRIVHGTGRLALTAGHQRRDFIQVDDAARAILTVVEASPSLPRGVPTQIGVGTGRATSLREFLELAHRIAGSSIELGWGDLPTRDGEPMSTGADTAWLQAHGWQPQVGQREGLADMIDHLRSEPA